MGRFVTSLIRDGHCIDRAEHENTLHREGSEYMMRRLFPIGGSFESVGDFRIGIAGIGCGGHPAVPNSTPVYNRDLSWYDIESDTSQEGGAAYDFHRGLIGYSRQSVSFSVTDEGYGAKIATADVTFYNNLHWANQGTWDVALGETPPLNYNRLPWEPSPGYPWQAPTWKHGFYGSSGVPGAISDMLTDDPRRGATYPVGIVFVVDHSSRSLITSARFRNCIEIRPDDALWVRYEGVIYP